ncbi:uncharacterized protein LOC123536776 [Mercenaria mercenaria]|uniref:uncharacterized protein LOC123536776 n=1 Tax=Mercenaria mercenaria TaxID=6596 RepID=UPI00234E7C8A|nr:uncharacterized protein LOC123536776 [Mercenaria mercenaria]
MEFKYNILFVAICAILHQADCLKCYSCNSLLEPKCGKTFELSGKEAASYVVKCQGENVACRKIESTDAHKEKMLVTRSCWNTTDDQLKQDFFECSNMGKGMACYCKGTDHGKPCNGAQPVLTYISIMMTLLSTTFYFIF